MEQFLKNCYLLHVLWVVSRLLRVVIEAVPPSPPSPPSLFGLRFFLHLRLKIRFIQHVCVPPFPNQSVTACRNNHLIHIMLPSQLKLRQDGAQSKRRIHPASVWTELNSSMANSTVTVQYRSVAQENTCAENEKRSVEVRSRSSRRKESTTSGSQSQSLVQAFYFHKAARGRVLPNAFFTQVFVNSPSWSTNSIVMLDADRCGDRNSLLY